MKKKILATTAAMLVSTAAHALPITQSQPLAVQGQDMTFDFVALPAATGPGSIVIAPAQGTGTLGLDLSGAFPAEDENFEVTFDGASQGFFSCGGPSNNGSTAIAGAIDNSSNFNNCEFTLTFDLTQAALAGLLADSIISVGVFFGNDVSTFGDNDLVTVTLNYEAAAVPEPVSLALLGLGLAGIGYQRRKQAKAA